jgi:DNA-binding transcriptional MerR regulator
MQLLSIGRFSRLTGLGVKALRHYDEIGLLPPEAVDEATGYRFYGARQLTAAEAIHRLRRLELPLEDIRRVLAANDAGVVRDTLVGHQRRLAVRGARLKAVFDPEEHRRLGIDLFNKTWTLMEKDGRTPAEDDELLHCAHASAYHWSLVGTVANRVRSEWQCSRVYAVLGRAEPALHHARRCLELAESAPSELEEFDLPFAYEAMARAHAVAGDEAQARDWLARASAAGEEIGDEDDRALLASDLATIG